MTAPKYGTTKLAHAQEMLADIEERIVAVRLVVDEGKPIKPATRESMWRSLAGAAGMLEGVRIWLQAGAPR